MASGKKAAEEKLERVFVPVEEQPYEIPDNWCWVKLQFICEYLKAGGDKPTSFVREKDEDHPIPVVANGIENDGIIGFTNTGKISAGTVSVSGRGTIGYSILREYEYMPVVRLIVIKPSNKLLPSYLKFAFDVFEEKGTGSSIPQLTVPMIKDKYIPLPPLPEQHRIVSRIESLFAKLNEAKEKAQAVVDGFELRKSAILHKAFTGELTERWRKEHGVGIESWRKRYLEDICQYMKAGGDKPDDFSECEDSEHCIPVVANGIAQDGIIGYTKEAKYAAGTVTVSGRGTIGYSIYRDYPIYPVVRLIVLCPIADVLPEFLKYVFDAYPEEGTGSSIPQLTVPSIKKKNIPLPTQEEQTRIIEILNNIFSKEQQAKSAAEAVLAQIDAMKKVILARAFRGELGTNDPAEERAGELLKTARKDTD